MRKLIIYLSILIIPVRIFGQSCAILSKANDITPDKLCSPVTASWTVNYTGVNNAGTPVSIRYDWDNGVVRTVPATQVSPGVFEATDVNTYTSAGNVCNYHPRATLIVNGVLCTSSSQEQIVTVWDNDDHNGGRMRINPAVYPICFGNSANVRFQDLTQFNCVPPQERDNPNVNTRWIQWIYGTDITMTGTPVTIDGRHRSFPYTDNIITLTGPVTGSGVWSDVINVDDDKLVGQYFQVTLRNWNYCNPYDDPAIPGPPRNRRDGDHPPVVTTAIILIVSYPDATITPVDTLCANSPPVALTAHDPGGTWSGPGLSGNIFNPALAGPGNHTIRYAITNANGCSDSDEITITVMPVPDATITTASIVCFTDSIITLTANDPGGVWSGPGVTGDKFNPAIAGPGNHLITYSITDASGCSDSDQKILTVATPDATITPVDTLCVNSPGITLTAHDLGGIWSGKGIIENTFHPFIAGAGDHLIRYNIVNADCKDADSTVITVMPLPEVIIDSVGTVFINSTPLTLNVTPAGGTFSGPGLTGNVFDPNAAGLGTHVIFYQSLPDLYGCTGTDTIHINVVYPPNPFADYEPDTVGCSPLVIQFNNNSVYGESYLWDFGDKTYSREENPIHTYYTPGNYLVRLNVYNITGTSYHQGEIIVYQNPKAVFSVYPTTVISNSEIVKFTNNSYYAASYLWDFGDNQTSTDREPWHQYTAPGVYNIKLTVISAEGCVDSFIYHTPITVDFREGYIRFANVFRWNRTGPTGGYWTEGSIDNTVFRPYFTNVSEYKMVIYNRWGNQIYETTDLYKGWDGYFGNDVLAMQGVYVFKVTGKYADGTLFEKVGDVTFLH